jgi:glycosyltransferase involved in cell wall biosynthesis
MKPVRKIALMAVGDSGWMGGIQYIINIMHALNSNAAAYPVEVHLFKNDTQHFAGIDTFSNIPIYIHHTKDVFKPFSLGNRIKWFLQRKIQGRINPRIENVMLEKKMDYVYPATLSSCNGKLNAGSWIADFQYHHFPHGADSSITSAAYKTISGIAFHTPKIVLSSFFCERDSFEIFPVTKGKTHVMPFAVYINEAIFEFNDFESMRQKYSLPQQFLLVANLFAPTKNHKTLFEALDILKEQGVTIPLVCTGNIHDYAMPEYADEILQLLTKHKIRSQVHLLGLIPRFDQVNLFRMSVAMVQPSINEGWSTCVEEAKCLGKNLLLADIEVHKEQYPGNPYFFESMNAQDLAAKIKTLWTAASAQSFPDIKREEAAFESYKENVIAFGKRFIEIANSN